MKLPFVKDYLMREQPWIAPLVSLMLAMASSRVAVAQAPVGASASGTVQIGSLDEPDEVCPVPPFPIQPSGYGPSAIGMPAPPGYPPGANPWPAISPYHGDYQHYGQHINRDGLWNFDTDHYGRRYYFGVDYTSTKSKEPHGIVGFAGAQSYKDEILPVITQGGGGGGGGGQNLQSLASAFRGTNLVGTSQQGQGQGQNNQTGFGTGLLSAPGIPAAGVLPFNYFDAVDANIMDRASADGIRINFGVVNPDDSAWDATLWWSGNGTTTWNPPIPGDTMEVVPTIDFPLLRIENRKNLLIPLLENGNFLPVGLGPLAPIDINTFSADQVGPNFLFASTLKNLRGLPLDNGTFGGITVPYDLEFTLVHETETYQANIDRILTPRYSRGPFQLRPVVGLRYMNVRELFAFSGLDSGLIYDGNEPGATDILPNVKLHSLPNGIDDNQDGIIDNAGSPEPVTGPVGGGGGGGGGGQSGSGRFIIISSPIHSSLKNVVRTHLAGPEVGLRYDLGGERFKIWGHTKFGLMVNREKLDLQGNNIGHGLTPDMLIDPANPLKYAFDEVEAHTHVSPLVEQSIFAEGRIFSKVPVLKRVALLDQANFKVGYTVVWASEIARASDSILWQGNPEAGLFPSIDIDRGNWYTSNWSFGVDWTY